MFFLFTAKTHNGYHNTYELFKNGRSMDGKIWHSINSFTYSEDGKRYAMLATDGQNWGGNRYISTNASMNLKETLVINGKKVNGNYGAPLWSPKKINF